MIVLAIFVIVLIYCFIVLYQRKQFVDFMLNKFRAPPIDPLVGHVTRIPLNPPGKETYQIVYKIVSLGKCKQTLKVKVRE